MQGHVNLVRSVKSFVSGLEPGKASSIFQLLFLNASFCCKNKNEAISVITHEVRTQSNNPIMFFRK